MSAGGVARLVVCLAIAGAEPTLAQPVVVVPDEPVCACEIRVTREVTLSDPDGRAGLARPLKVERAANGHFLVVPGNRQGEVLDFGADGVFVRRIGRPGQGPREFGAILGLATGPAGSTYLLDAGNRRLVVLDPDLEIVRSRRLPVAGGWFGVLDDGSVVVLTGLPRGGGESRDRLVLLGPELDTVRTFLPSTAPTFPAEIRAARRRIGVAPDGTIAVGHVDRYHVELWHSDGTHGRTLVRSPPWFPSDPDPVDPGARDAVPPAPRLDEAPRVAPDGRIWTVSWIADEDWREALGPVRSIRGETVTAPVPERQSDHLDAVIESLDPVAGRVRASTRVDPALRLIADDGWAAAYREDEVGRPFVDIYRLEVVDRGGGLP